MPAGRVLRPVRRPSGLIVPGSIDTMVRSLEVPRRPIIVRGASTPPVPSSSPAPASLEVTPILANPAMRSEAPTLTVHADVAQRVPAMASAPRKRQRTFARAAALAAVLVLSALGIARGPRLESNGIVGRANPSPEPSEARAVSWETARGGRSGFQRILYPEAGALPWEPAPVPTSHLVAQRRSADRRSSTQTFGAAPASEGQVADALIVATAAPTAVQVATVDADERAPAPATEDSAPVAQPAPAAAPPANSEVARSASETSRPASRESVATATPAKPSAPRVKAIASKRKASRKPVRRTIVATRTEAPALSLPDALKPQ